MSTHQDLFMARQGIAYNVEPQLQAEPEAPAAERLPFTVKAVATQAELAKAVAIRHAAYARHMPDFARTLREPEPYDSERGSILLLAESKLDGSPLGSIRIQTNRHKKLNLEHSVELPDELRHATLAQASRLGVLQGRVGSLVKIVLFKAYYLYCLQAGIEWMVIAARTPLDRQYQDLLFVDVFDDGQFVPIRHAGNIPHRVMAFDVQAAERRWRAAQHKLYNFVFRTHHPDIDVAEPRPAYPVTRPAEALVLHS